MKLPDYAAMLVSLPRDGVALRLATSKADIPGRSAKQLTIIGDDPLGGDGLGPRGWDCTPFRYLLRGLNPGAIGVFAGGPVFDAYAALSLAAARLDGGAVIIECSNARFDAWWAYTEKHVPKERCARFDVAPPGHAKPPPGMMRLDTKWP